MPSSHDYSRTERAKDVTILNNLLNYLFTTIYIVACHLPRGSKLRWHKDMGGGLEGSPNVQGPHIGWSQYDTNSNKITNNNAKYTPYLLLVLIENNGGGSRQYISP